MKVGLIQMMLQKMTKIKIDNMEYEWDGKDLVEFTQIKECLEILKQSWIELERIKAANKRIETEHRKQLNMMRKNERR